MELIPRKMPLGGAYSNNATCERVDYAVYDHALAFREDKPFHVSHLSDLAQK